MRKTANIEFGAVQQPVQLSRSGKIVKKSLHSFSSEASPRRSRGPLPRVAIISYWEFLTIILRIFRLFRPFRPAMLVDVRIRNKQGFEGHPRYYQRCPQYMWKHLKTAYHHKGRILTMVGCPRLLGHPATSFVKPGGLATPPACERGQFSFFGTSLSSAIIIDFSTEGQKEKEKRK